ncbi:YHYH protein [Noviherbaspirillum galbum]|uniref:YHYH protein n=1 Tax=Noviherbaspirillum galbum TaxID=2709383 RepID=A0A6B3STD3_9BURK|nr:YHYH protein [Noviherbaspirillum galbum]NEX60879.1 YHYH protein [Noviherbaspirillum galbum]
MGHALRHAASAAIAIGVLTGCSGGDGARLAGTSTDKQLAQSAVYAGQQSTFFYSKRANYSVFRSGNVVTVTDIVGTEGTVTLNGVTRLYFSDSAIAFDTDGIAGQVYRLYRAAFNRQPDAVGLGFQISAAEVSGLSLLQLAQNFAASPEYQQLYGANNTNSQFVTQLYINTLHRSPDDAGLAFHIKNLETGIVTRASLLYGFSESPENKQQVASEIASGIAYTSWNVSAPATVPGAPVLGSVAPGSGLATLSFTAPSFDGGSAITNYAASCTSGTLVQSANGTASPIVVKNLSNGTAYSCSVKATNAIGVGSASAAVAVTPSATPAATAPGAPSITSAMPGNGSVTLSFTAPASDGGSGITGYSASCAAGTATPVTVAGTASPLTVPGLTNGLAYACSIKAGNAVGQGIASATSTVTPSSSVAGGTAPGAPTLVTAIAGPGTVTLGFNPPSSTGDSAITGYTATCSATTGTTTAAGSVSPLSVTGLSNGTTYSCSVKAANSAGTGTASGVLTAMPVTTGTLTGHLYCPYSASVSMPALNLTSTVTMSCTGMMRDMTANGVPDHVTGTFPNANNPNKIGAVSVKFGSPLNPAVVSTTGTALAHIVGFANNGIKFDPATAESYQNAGKWNIEALGQTYMNLGTDSSNAHVQPDGSYHYHGIPEGYVNKLNASPSTQMTMLGFANDGFPIYARYGYVTANSMSSGLKVIKSSYRLKATPDSGRPSTSIVPLGTFTQDYEYVAGLGDLDECNGRVGVTPEFPAGIYHYFVTDTYPYIQRCIKGTAAP